MPDCTSSTIEEHAVRGGDRGEALKELRRRHDVSAFALYRLDDDRRNFVGRHEVRQDLIFDVREALARAPCGIVIAANRTPVRIRVRRVKHAGAHRSKPAALHGSARCQRQRSKRAAVKRPEKRDDVEPLCVISRELDGGFDRLGARVRKERLRAAADRRDRRERFAQRDLRLVIVVGGNMEEPRRLLRDRADNVGMRMSRRRHRDARAEIQIRVAVDVFDDGAFAARHDERRAARIRRRHDRAIALEDRARARAGRRNLDVGNAHGFYRRSEDQKIMSFQGNG